MSRFVNAVNGVVIVVDDSKDDRYTGALWTKATAKTAEKKSAATTSK